MSLGAAAFGKRFRIYTLATLVIVVIFNGLALSYVSAVNAGDPTPYIGLYERVAFTAYFLWQTVLAVILWRRGESKPDTGMTNTGRGSAQCPDLTSEDEPTDHPPAISEHGPGEGQAKGVSR